MSVSGKCVGLGCEGQGGVEEGVEPVAKGIKKRNMIKEEGKREKNGKGRGRLRSKREHTIE